MSAAVQIQTADCEADYEAALSSAFALMAANPIPGTPESAVVERMFGLDPIAAASTVRFYEAMKAAAKVWANEQ